VPLCKASQLT